MSSSPIYDLVGVGFGPANLALSGALIDKWEDASNVRTLFDVLAFRERL